MTSEEWIEENAPAAVERAQRTALEYGLDPNEAISAGLGALSKGAQISTASLRAVRMTTSIFQMSFTKHSWRLTRRARKLRQPSQS